MSDVHTVRSFDEELATINAGLNAMGQLADAMVDAAIRALLKGDQELAQTVIIDDRRMDVQQRDIDERAVTLIAKRQPMAQDLRFVVGAIRIASDLERIGDLAKSIAKRAASSTGAKGPMHGLKAMAKLARTHLAGVLGALAAREAEALAAVRDDDERIDELYTGVFRELLTYMMEDPRSISSCTQLLFCAKNLERIGDHVTNIAEDAYYMITGNKLPIWRPKLDESGMQADGGAES